MERRENYQRKFAILVVGGSLGLTVCSLAVATVKNNKYKKTNITACAGNGTSLEPSSPTNRDYQPHHDLNIIEPIYRDEAYTHSDVLEPKYVGRGVLVCWNNNGKLVLTKKAAKISEALISQTREQAALN